MREQILFHDFFFVLQTSIARYPLIKIQEGHWQVFFGAFTYSYCQQKLCWSSRLWDVSVLEMSGLGDGQMHSLSSDLLSPGTFCTFRQS